MSQQDPLRPDRPTPDQLAGVYVYIEAEEKVTIHPPSGPVPPLPTTADSVRPTTAELAGVYVYIEAEEKVILPPSPDTPS